MQAKFHYSVNTYAEGLVPDSNFSDIVVLRICSRPQKEMDIDQKTIHPTPSPFFLKKSQKIC